MPWATVSFARTGQKAVSYRIGEGFAVGLMEDKHARAIFLPLVNGQSLCVNAEGHFRGTPGIENEIVYAVLLEDGRQEKLTPAEFGQKYNWKNNPDRVQPLAP